MKAKAVVLAIVGVLAVAAVGVAGVLGYQAFFGAPQDEAVALVPQDALVYGHIFLDPSNDQKRAIGDILDAFPEAPNFDEARGDLVDLIDEGLGEVDMSFESDIEPWLGDQVAGFSLLPENLGSGAATDSGSLESEAPPAAFLVRSTDDDAALAFIDKGVAASDENLSDASHEGIDYKLDDEEGSAVGVVDGFVVIGSETGLKAVIDASQGDANLSDDENFSDTTGELVEDRLATFYFDGRKLTEALEEGGMPGGAELGALGGFSGFGVNTAAPVAAALFAESDKVVFESISELNEDSQELAQSLGGGLLSEVPADSWGALGLSDLGTLIEGAYDSFSEAFAEGGTGTNELDAQFEAQTGLNLREDLLSWMGDAGLFVSGTDPNSIGGGLVVESTDPATSSQTLATIEGLVQQAGVQTEPLSLAGAEGFRVTVPDSPQPIVVLGADRVVIAFGEQAAINALEGGDTLSGSEAFQRAAQGLGEGFTPAGYFDLNVIQTLAENTGASQVPDYEGEIKPWVDPLSYVTFGSRTDGDRLVQRMVIGIDQ